MKSLLATANDPRGARGAILAEFAVAIVPLLTMFFTFAQAAFAYSANIMLHHAANTGVRAAAVILPPNPGNVGSEADVDAAVHAALGRWNSSFQDVHIIKTPASRPYELVRIEVQASYRCRVPLGALVMCGADGLLQMRPVTAEYPNQGAEYTQ